MSLVFLANIIALLFSLFVVGAIIGALLSHARGRGWSLFETRNRLLLGKSRGNPILTPGSYPWTAEAVLNPAAVMIDGRTHLLYRAIGSDGVSRLGYASGKDGVSFDDLPPYPAYVARDERPFSRLVRRYAPVLYPSGGSWGGCEDPRMVAIDGRIYVTYNAFDGWDFIRVALISIAQDDFLAKRWWRWQGPAFLSPEGERHKNWVLFPEKIGGKFAILHNLHGDDQNRVRVEYVDHLDTFRAKRGFFASPDPSAMPSQKIVWHERMRAAGAPPIKTDRGWLLFYHATTAEEGHRYQLGALLLSLDDPSRVLARAAFPVLSPDEHYENEGKAGVVYACGAVVRDGLVFVYYGGGDKVACVAATPLAPFLEGLLSGAPAALNASGH